MLGPARYSDLNAFDALEDATLDAVFVSSLNHQIPLVDSYELYKFFFDLEESLNIEDKLPYFSTLDEVSYASLVVSDSAPLTGSGKHNAT